MAYCFRFAIALGGVFLSGCSTHPIPADRIGLSVYDIAHKIRCEAREVVYRQANTPPQRPRDIAEYEAADARLKRLVKDGAQIFGRRAPQLAAERERLSAQEHLINAKLRELVAKLNEGPDPYKELREWSDSVLGDGKNLQENSKKTRNEIEKTFEQVKELDRWRRSKTKNEADIRHHISRWTLFHRDRLYLHQKIVRERQDVEKRFADSIKFLGNSFAYAMRFEIDETNEARINTADFTRAVTLGTITIGVAAGDKKQRKGRREIRVVATFRELLGLEKECEEGKYFMAEDGLHTLRYPIRGRIGLDEVITEYLTILRSKFALSEVASSGKTYMSIITFTTTIDGSIKPSATIARSSGDRYVGNALLSGQRQDVHEATIVLMPLKAQGPVEPDKTVNVRIVRSNSLLQE